MNDENPSRRRRNNFEFFEDEQMQELSDDDLRDNLYAEYITLTTTHNISKLCSKSIWDFILQNCEKISYLKERRHLHSYSTIVRHTLESIPDCKMTVSIKNNETKEVITLYNLSKFPSIYLDSSLWTRQYTLTKMNLEEIIKYHKFKHPNELFSSTIDWGQDGIPEYNNSTKKGLDIMTIRFYPCKEVYPLAVFHQGEVKNLPVHEYIGPIVEELNKSNIQVKICICDAPKRSYLKNVKGHNSKYPCSYCIVSGTYLHGSMSFPFLESSAPQRTDFNFRLTGQNMDSNPNSTNPNPYGIVGSTPLSKLENFNLIRQIPPEYSHSILLGITKVLLQNFLPEDKPTTSNNLTLKLSKINEELLKIRVPSDFSRTTRKFIIKNLKCEEFRNILIFYFPIFFEVLTEREIYLLSHLSFIIRCLILPDIYYHKIKENINLIFLISEFCKGFEQYTDGKHCNYNYHQMRHLLQMRELGP